MIVGMTRLRQKGECNMCQYPCRNCVYYKECGESTRTMPCNGRMTKTDKKRREALIAEGEREQARRAFYED